MKIRLIQMVSLLFILMLSMGVYAGGAGCESKSGHDSHEMSAEALQQFKHNHAWMFSEDTDADTSVPGHDGIEMDQSKQPEKSTTSDLVEI